MASAWGRTPAPVDPGSTEFFSKPITALALICSCFIGDCFLRKICNCVHNFVPHLSHLSTQYIYMSKVQVQQQQHSLFSQASWGRLEMKPERNKFKVLQFIQCPVNISNRIRYL